MKIDSSKNEILIEDSDLWNLDITLAKIIHPCLVRLKENQEGSPYTEMEDVPEELRCEIGPDFEDPTIHDRWEWVLSEMIWAFENVLHCKEHEFSSEIKGKDIFEIENTNEKGLSTLKINLDVDEEGLKAYTDRRENGLMLFGKYFRNLWT